jgi:uncharacterized protein
MGMTTPITNYILKSTSFCNINCSYCYIFNVKDTTFRNKAKVMPLEVLERAASQMSELAVQQGVKNISVTFHGGEPMLAGMEWFQQAISHLKDCAKDKHGLRLSMQTNAILIDDAWLDLIEQHRIGIGVSLDGPPHINDRARVNFAGRSTYNGTVAGIQKLLSRKLMGGILCVIDPDVDGLEIYKHFLTLGVNQIDFLWPLEHTWESPPPSHASQSTPYADYLIPIFDEWWKTGNGKVRIRYFENIIKGLMGAQVGLDSLGANPISTVILDTNGSIEPLDSLRVCEDNLTDVGLNLATDRIVDLYNTRLFKATLAGRQGLCSQCQSCPIHTTCGAGYLPQRYSREKSFDNPNVYCRDLWKFITHIASTLASELRRSQPAPEAIAS